MNNIEIATDSAYSVKLPPTWWPIFRDSELVGSLVGSLLGFLGGVHLQKKLWKKEDKDKKRELYKKLMGYLELLKLEIERNYKRMEQMYTVELPEGFLPSYFLEDEVKNIVWPDIVRHRNLLFKPGVEKMAPIIDFYYECSHINNRIRNRHSVKGIRTLVGLSIQKYLFKDKSIKNLEVAENRLKKLREKLGN